MVGAAKSQEPTGSQQTAWHMPLCIKRKAYVLPRAPRTVTKVVLLITAYSQQAVRVLCLGVDVDSGTSPSSALPVLCGIFPSF